MGLDITAYQELTKVENPELDGDGYPVDYDSHWKARHLDSYDKSFPGRSEGLKNGTVYSFHKSFGFRAGSYGGYSQWRRELAQLAGYASDTDCWENHKSGPFFELINFYDNEGTIGPVVAKKLAKDFTDHHKMAAIVGGYFFERYCDWENAFNMAADNGAVDFH
jgi:hypothetical protein